MIIYKLESDEDEVSCCHLAAIVGERPLSALLLGGGDLPNFKELVSGRKKLFVRPVISSDRMLLFEVDNREEVRRLRLGSISE